MTSTMIINIFMTGENLAISCIDNVYECKKPMVNTTFLILNF